MKIKKLSTLLIKHIHTEAATYVWLICYSMQWQQCMCMHVPGSQQSLTVIGDQALARSKQQVDFAASCLDQLDCPSVRDALRGLAVDLHDLISNLGHGYSDIVRR